MRSIKILTICLFILVWAALWSKTPIQNIRLREVLSIGSPDSDLLYQWVGVVADEHQNLYVTDSMDYSIKKFDSKGNLIKKVGRKGQGPGEFSAPRLVGCTEKLIYVTDQYKLFIQIFDKDLNYIGKIEFLSPIVDMLILSDNSIVIAPSIWKGQGKIITINAHGEIISELVYSKQESTFLMNNVDFEVDSRGCYYLVYNYQDRIEKLDANGNLIWKRELFGGKKVKPENKGGLLLPGYFIYKDIALDGKGNVFVLGGSLSKNKSRDVYVLDVNGNMKSTITLPDSTHCIYLDKNNNLYSRANEGMTLKKIALEF